MAEILASVAVSAAAVSVASWTTDPTALSAPWLPSMGSGLALKLDGFGAPLALYAAAITVPVLASSGSYVPAHLEEKGRPLEEKERPPGDAVPARR